MRALWFYLVLALIALASSGCCYGYTLDQWADAIHHAEENDNYGILKHYKISYRQACKNTVLHKYHQWIKMGRRGRFIDYLGSKYCPVGALDDPHELNVNWIRNVSYYIEH